MNEQELKIIVQAVLEGKTIQAMKQDLVPNWTDIENRSIENMLKFIVPNFFGYSFRVKPEVKTFKYKTRPCLFKRADGTTGFDVWTSTSPSTEDTFRINRSFRLLNQESHPVYFEWLAPATEWTVDYE